MGSPNKNPNRISVPICWRWRLGFLQKSCVWLRFSYLMATASWPQSYGHSIVAGYLQECYIFLFIKDCIAGAQVLPTNFLLLYRSHSTCFVAVGCRWKWCSFSWKQDNQLEGRGLQGWVLLIGRRKSCLRWRSSALQNRSSQKSPESPSAHSFHPKIRDSFAC